MRAFLLFTFLISTGISLAGKNEFSLEGIPDSLLQGSNSIVRLYEASLQVSAPGKAEYHVHKIVTVLKDAGAHELMMNLYYNKFSKVTSFKALLYDKTGKLMNKRSESDFKDYAVADGFSLFNDSRIKHMQTSGGMYPVTIDYNYTIQYEGMLDYPQWYIQEANQSVEQASFELIVPENIGINYKVSNLNLQPIISQQKNIVSYTWTAKNLKSFKIPEHSYEARYFLPRLDISPSDFEIGGYKGSWNSWKEFGLAMNTMWKDSRSLPDAALAEVKTMVKDAKSEREKAAIIYSYLQHNFRYVSVQIGIGGWIPFDAATVHSTKYGDCKALSNYTCSLLNAVGIKAYPALINAGRYSHPIDTVFPSNYFNHAICYAELSDGPLWLECTSNSLPFGELSTFTENKYALIFDQSGGRITPTPTADASLNTININSNVQIAADLKSTISSSTSLRGEFRGYAKNGLLLASNNDRTHYVFNTLHLRQAQTFQILNVRDSLSQISFDISGEDEKLFDFRTGNKVFFPSSMIKTWYENISVDSTSFNDLVIDFPSTKNEQLTYQIPDSAGYTLPSDFAFDNQLLSFKRKCSSPEHNKVMIETELRIKKYIIPFAEISFLKESLQKVNKYLQQKLIVLVN